MKKRTARVGRAVVAASFTAFVVGALLAGASLRSLAADQFDTETREFSFRYSPGGYDVSGVAYLPGDAAGDVKTLIVASHGFQNYKEQLLPYCQLLAERGFVVVAFDLPGHHHTGGYTSLSFEAVPVVRAGIDHVLANEGRFGGPLNQTHVGVFGHSMGAMTSVQVATVDPRVHAVASLASPANLSRVVGVDPLLGAVISVIENAGPEDLAKIAPLVNPVARVNASNPKNFLVVHGTDDATVPVSEALELYSAAAGGATSDQTTTSGGGDRRLLLLEGKGHDVDSDPVALNETVAWFQRHFPPFGEGQAGALGVTPGDLAKVDAYRTRGGSLVFEFWGFVLGACLLAAAVASWSLDWARGRPSSSGGGAPVPSSGSGAGSSAETSRAARPWAANALPAWAAWTAGMAAGAAAKPAPLALEGLYLGGFWDANLLALVAVVAALQFSSAREERGWAALGWSREGLGRGAVVVVVVLATFLGFNAWLDATVPTFDLLPRQPLAVGLVAFSLLAFLPFELAFGSAVTTSCYRLPLNTRLGKGSLAFLARCALAVPSILLLASARSHPGVDWTLFVVVVAGATVAFHLLSVVAYNFTRHALPGLALLAILASCVAFELAPRFAW
ncbi:MAG: hypothetical protein Kow0069_08120 [Promethearchaeota archaeon]